MKKSKVLIIVFLLSIIILTTIISVTFSKYAIERKDTHILESDAFYFNSSLTQQEYQLNEWNGKDVQNIKFNVKNYLDNMQITEQDIKYDIKAQITNEDAQLVNLELKDENGSIVTTKEESDTEHTTFTVSGLTLKADTTAEQILTTNNYSITISPKNSELEEGKIINVKLEISSTEPYTKEITSNIKLTVHTVSNYVGNIIESDNGEYIKLNIKVNNPEKDLNIKYDNTKLELDKSNYLLDDVYPVSQTTMNSFTIPKAKLEKGNTYEITFIKKVQDKIKYGTDVIIDEDTMEYTKGIITFTSPIWKSNKASVTITNGSTYSMQYKIVDVNDDIDETDTTGWVTVNPKNITLNNLKFANKIIARLYDGTNYTQYASCIISDGITPTITANATNTTTREISIQANSMDDESGLTTDKPYKYYIAQSLDAIANATVNGSNTTGTYTFENLDANTTYYIKVEREDVAGNKGSTIIVVKTLMVPSAKENIARVITWNATTTPDTAQAKIGLSTETGFIIKYGTNKDDRTNWKEYNGEITVTNGDTIYIALTDGRNYGLEDTLKIEDKTGPDITITKTETKTNSISIKVEASDSGAGMSENVQYDYYIKEEGASTYKEKAENQTSNTYKFTNLIANKNYKIIVKTKDLIGNQGEGSLVTTTSKFDLITGDITFSKASWADKTASVEVKNNTENQMQYQIIQDGQDIKDDAWITTAEKTVTVNNLKNNYTIIARLYDGTNYTKYASIQIQDKTAPTISVAQEPSDWTKGAVKLTITATDTESGLPADAYSFDGGATWQAETNKTYTENTSGIVIKVKDIAGNIATYDTINITNIDKTGPEFEINTKSTSSTITVNVNNTTDSGVGLEDLITYHYYIATSETGLASAEEATDTTANKTSSKVYTGLTQGITYYIKVEVADKLGNTTSKIVTVETGSIATDFTISDPTWSDKKASLKITNNSEYKLQYQIVTNLTESPKADGWTTVDSSDSKEVTCSNLLNNYVIYARLTDGTNNSATLQKQIKDVTAPTLEISGNPTEWTKEDVTISITATDTESGLPEEAYSFDGGITWQTEPTKTYTQNTTGIIIKVRDIAGNVETKTIDITKIDKNGPQVEIQEQAKDINFVTVSVTATDDGIGMPDEIKYKYSYRKEGDSNYTNYKETTENTCKFEKLLSNKKYYLKVETQDKLGNSTEKEIEVTTSEFLYTTGQIEFSNTIWRSSIARITANNKSIDYNLEYQIKTDSAQNPDVSDSSKWTKATEKTINIGNLEDGNVVYARLTDGINSTTGYASITINNSAVKEYSEAEFAKITRSNYEVLGVSATSNKIEVQINKNAEGALYNYYYKTINDTNYKLMATNTYYDDKATVTGLTANQVYKIKVLVTDTEGNITRCQNTATIITAEQANVDTTYTGNRTYIDNSSTLQARVQGENGYGDTAQKESINAGYTISLPQGFKVSGTTGENLQSQGTVLKDGDNNEYVWIPVNDAIHDGNTSIPTNTTTAQNNNYKPMAIAQSSNKGYYEGLVYDFNGTLSFRRTSNTGVGNSSYREPSLVTGNSDGYTWNVDNVTGIVNDADSKYYKTILGFSSASEFGEYIANNYNNMILSVDSFGGFYVSRYETTQTKDSSENVIIGSKKNGTVFSGYNWYNMYLYQDSRKYASNPYSSSKSVVSSMIWGSQYDAVLNYLLTGLDAKKVTTQVGSQKNVLSNTAQDNADIINNIYDLGSNANEWTQEAEGTRARVYRGGGYDKTKKGTPATRTTVTATDSGPIFGSRLQLYVRSTSDTTGPIASIISTSATTNTITVKATAQDKETGVSKYTYYIKESSNPSDSTGWTKMSESSAGNYTYTKLKQNTTYSIKVTATDGAGNEGDGAVTTVVTKELGNVAKDNISLKNKYGQSGEGTVLLEQKDTTYSNQGYYIQYQVISSDSAITENWATGETIKGLANGQIIYASLFDGINRSADYFEFKVSGLEGFEYYTDSNGNSSKEKTVTYTDSEGNTATIPAGFKVGTGDSTSKVNEGLVVQDENGNEFVWVPVPVAVETTNNKTSTEKAIARKQSSNTKYYEGILYDFNGTTSTKQRSSTALNDGSMREPSLVTGSSDYTWNVDIGKARGVTYDAVFYTNFQIGSATGFGSYTEFGQYMNEQYTNMVKSVDKFKGFYIGRYETSTSNDNLANTAVVQSQKNKAVLYNRTWYQSYYYQDSNINAYNPYHNSKSVVSSMIWGSQWDATLNWMLKDNNTKNFVTSIVGNRTGTRANSGQYSDDLAKNIFDLSANVVEWAQEAHGTTYRTYRGGSFLKTTDKYGIYGANARINSWRPPTANCIYMNPTNTGGDGSTNGDGSRLALYINNTEDSTAPIIDTTATNNTLTTETNNITIKTQVTDAESGIKKYKYTISYKDFSASDFSDKYIVKSVENYGWTYQFTGLNQNTPYYIKVEVTNNAGLTSTYYSNVIQTKVLNVTEDPSTLKKTYGKTGNGAVYLTLANTYKTNNYRIQYQIVKSGSAPTDNGWKEGSKVNNNGQTFTDGYIVKGLSVGDIVYTRITDGKNNSSNFKTTEVSELETYSDIQTANYTYTDSNKQQAVIPAGFRYGTSSLNNTIKNGLVIEDEAGNQYVWVPVKNAIYDGVTTVALSNNSSTYKPMARTQSGYTRGSTSTYYEGMFYDYSGIRSYIMGNSLSYRVGATSYREPSLVTGSDKNLSWQYSSGTEYDAANYSKLSSIKDDEITISSPATLGQYINKKFTEMVESVDKYGGFYVGRYETSRWNSGSTTNKENSGDIIKSVAGAITMASTNWYDMYLRSSSGYSNNPYYNSTSVNCAMIWGCQYDATLNYILEGSDNTKVTQRTGNHSGTRSITGEYPNDIMNNIFDLSSNVREWTQEAYSSRYRTDRGGYYLTDDTTTAVYRFNGYSPISTNYNIGSRLTLYLK